MTRRSWKLFGVALTLILASCTIWLTHQPAKRVPNGAPIAVESGLCDGCTAVAGRIPDQTVTEATWDQGLFPCEAGFHSTSPLRTYGRCVPDVTYRVWTSRTEQRSRIPGARPARRCEPGENEVYKLTFLLRQSQSTSPVSTTTSITVNLDCDTVLALQPELRGRPFDLYVGYTRQHLMAESWDTKTKKPVEGPHPIGINDIPTFATIGVA